MKNNLSAIAGNDSLVLPLNDVKLCCYVLENQLRVVTKDSIQAAMGYYGKTGDWLFDFISYLDKYRPIDPQLLLDVKETIYFHAPGDPNKILHGIIPETLIKACKTIVRYKEDGFLFVSELKFAKVAEVIDEKLRNNTNDQIDFASGYDLYKQNHKQALSRIIMEHHSVFKWAVTFPDSFYESVFRLQNWTWADLTKIEAFNFVHDIVFSRINAQIRQNLSKTRPKMKQQKDNISERYLEHTTLQPLVLSIISFAKASDYNIGAFGQLLDQAFPVLHNIEKLPIQHLPDEEFSINLNDTLRLMLSGN